jgi:6-phosphogluconolactonase
MKIPDALDIIVHDDIEALSVAVARRIAMISAQAIGERGIVSIVLAGGETPRRCHELLREMPVDWKHVQVYFGDERCLPRGDMQRNDSMAHVTLLMHVAIPPGNVHAIPAEHGARMAAAEYARILEHALPFDLVLLGMGEDGHTASLFPGNPATEQQAIVVPVFDAPKPPLERVSLGMGTLNSAREKMFLVSGKTKQEALWKIARGVALPAARVTKAEWHVDRAALPDEIARKN